MIGREALWNDRILGGFLFFIYFFNKPLTNRKIRSLKRNINIKYGIVMRYKIPVFMVLPNELSSTSAPCSANILH